MLERRKLIYPLLVKVENRKVESIVNNDVIRTNRQKFLFSEMTSFGTIKLWNVCKAIGCFFPEIGYVQGMNFVVWFILEVSGFEEFLAFNFIINFWKKNKNLYIGVYQQHFPLIGFLCFAFHYLLKLIAPKIELVIIKMDLPNELWISKWFLSFYTSIVNKEYLLRIFDYLIIQDCFGLVNVALAITLQLKECFLKGNMGKLNGILNDWEKLSKNLDFYKFVKKIKSLDFSSSLKLKILNIYYHSLSNQQQKYFGFYYQNLKEHFSDQFPSFFNDFDSIKNYYQDYDTLSIKELQNKVQQTQTVRLLRSQLQEPVSVQQLDTHFNSQPPMPPMIPDF